VLIVCLIVLSLSTVDRLRNSQWTHVRVLTNCFNVLASGQSDMSIYDRGDNIDETIIEIATLADIK
jgi:hypothetical protein